MPSNGHCNPTYAERAITVGQYDPQYPQGGSTSYTWENADYVAGDTPNTAATVEMPGQGRSDFLYIYFNLDAIIPLNVIAITGIQFEVEEESPVERKWASVKAVQASQSSPNRGSIYNEDTNISSTKQFRTWGGPGDLWDLTWTRSEVTLRNFGLMLEVYRDYLTNGPAVRVYRVRTVVYYTVPTPAVAVSPASLSFKMTKGQTNPLGKTVNITNTGEANSTLTWSQSDNTAWLTVTPNGGSAPGTATIGVSAQGLAPGTYNGIVTFTSTNAPSTPKQVPVEFIITESDDESFQAVI